MGLKWGGIFGILKIFFKIFFFKKVHYFWVWRLFVGVYCGFGEIDLFLGLGIDIGGGGVCVLFEVDFWIIFGFKRCAETLVFYSSKVSFKKQDRLEYI